MNKYLDVGDRVIFVPENSRFKESLCNPVMVEGTVTDIEGWIDVEWDNKEWNAYHPDSDDLKLVSRNDKGDD